MYNEFEERKRCSVTYVDNGNTITEKFEDARRNEGGVFVKRNKRWGYILQGKGLVIPTKYYSLAELECDLQGRERIMAAGVSDKTGVMTFSHKKICDFKYKSVNTKYYGLTGCIIVEDGYGLKGVVKECREKIALLYHSITFDYEKQLWKCTFDGLRPDYYTIDCKKV